jgi:hypothetical protein
MRGMAPGENKFTGRSPRVNFHSEAAKATETREHFTEGNEGNEGVVGLGSA